MKRKLNEFARERMGKLEGDGTFTSFCLEGRMSEMAMGSVDYTMRVKWGDCDAAGISYYAKNFEWFTDARFELFAHYGFPYMETFHHKGISLVCLKAESDYKKMIRPLEEITIKTSISELTRTRMAFTYQIVKSNGELAAEGFTAHAYVNSEGRPLNLKKSFPALWNDLSIAQSEKE